jgi:hypothetical protein
VDQADDHAAAPRPGIDIAPLHDAGIDAGDLLADIIDGQARPFLLLDLKQLRHTGIVQHPLGVAERPHDEPCIALIRRDEGCLDLIVDRGFLRRDEAGSHVDAIGSQGERGHQPAAIADAARCQERYRQGVGRAGQQDEVGDIVFSGMTATFEPVDTHRVAPDFLSLQGVPHGSAFMEDLDSRPLECRHPGLRTPPGRLHDPHARAGDSVDIFGIGRRGEHRQECQVHAERTIGQILAAGDLTRQQLRRTLGEPGDHPQAARIGHRRGKLGQADMMHAALDDRVLDSKQVRDPSSHRSPFG